MKFHIIAKKTGKLDYLKKKNNQQILYSLALSKFLAKSQKMVATI